MKKAKKITYLNFNVNNNILVKLEPEGYEVWKKEAEEWIIKMNAHNPPRMESESYDEHHERFKKYRKYITHLYKIGVHPLAWYKAKADKKGYVRFQAWQFIEIFGKHTAIGSASIYNTNILIDKEDFSVVK